MVKILCMVDIYHYTLSQTTECTTQRLYPEVNYGMPVIMICPSKLGKKCTILVNDTGNGGSYACVGAIGYMEISVPFSFVVNLKLL